MSCFEHAFGNKSTQYTSEYLTKLVKVSYTKSMLWVFFFFNGLKDEEVQNKIGKGF